jgi:predicted membrane channel-forming protein YqfA (hemolysin III family)
MTALAWCLVVAAVILALVLETLKPEHKRFKPYLYTALGVLVVAFFIAWALS